MRGARLGIEGEVGVGIFCGGEKGMKFMVLAESRREDRGSSIRATWAFWVCLSGRAEVGFEPKSME